jgi:hypothetical protein
MSCHDLERLILSKPAVTLHFMKVLADRLNKAKARLEDYDDSFYSFSGLVLEYSPIIGGRVPCR